MGEQLGPKSSWARPKSLKGVVVEEVQGDQADQLGREWRPGLAAGAAQRRELFDQGLQALLLKSDEARGPRLCMSGLDVHLHLHAGAAGGAGGAGSAGGIGGGAQAADPRLPL